MKRENFIAIIGCSIVYLLPVIGCDFFTPPDTAIPPSDTPTSTDLPTLTRTPKPTRTPTPTITPTPTSTFTPTITFTPTVSPGGFPRRFHVEANAFVDQFSQKMIFRGMAMPDPMHLAFSANHMQPEWNEHYFQVMASWGANIVRVPILMDSLHGDSWSTILQTLDQTIAWAGENKMYVVIDFHSSGSLAYDWYGGHPGDTTNREEFLDFWDKISQQYDDNDTVAFYELFNEPSNPTLPTTKSMWTTWKSMAEKAVAVIRKNDPDKIILVGGIYWAYDLSFTAADPLKDKNVGYATHPYPPNMKVEKKDWDTAFGKLSDRYPVIATEFGYQDTLPDYENSMVGDKHYNQAIVDYMEEHHISWIAWIFDNIWYTSLLLDKNFTPSPSGEYFRSRLLELNFPGVPMPPSSTPLPAPTD